MSEPGDCTGAVFRIAPGECAQWIDALHEHSRAVLVIGPDASANDVIASLDAIARDAPETLCRTIVLTRREWLADFQPLLNEDRLFYLSSGDLSERDLDALIDSALGAHTPVAPDRFLGAVSVRRIAFAQSTADFADALRLAIAETVSVERARCVLHDSERQVLWVPNETAGESPAVGLASFVLRTGMTVCLSRLDGDARFDPEADDPHGDPSDRFLGVPVRANGAVVAVLVAIRPAHALPFEPRDVAALEALAAHASPYAAAWLAEPESTGPFRSRALREQEQPLAAAPELLRLDHAWTRRATWLVFTAFVALLIALAAWGWLLE